MWRSSFLRRQVHARTATHVNARALSVSEQLHSIGIKDADVQSASVKNGTVSARCASSLLQDWVMLAHRRPIHTASDVDPSFNVSARAWSDQECALIAHTLQLRDFEPARTSLRVSFPVSTTPAAATVALTESTAPPPPLPATRSIPRMKRQAVAAATPPSSSTSTTPGYCSCGARGAATAAAKAGTTTGTE